MKRLVKLEEGLKECIKRINTESGYVKTVERTLVDEIGQLQSSRNLLKQKF